MSEQQPNALRLANDAMCRLPGNDGAEIAAELRRLHDVESAAMVELLRRQNLIDSLEGVESQRTELSRLQAERGEVVAWLFKCAKPGKRIEFATVDENDTNHWPLDQWKTVEKFPLVHLPAAPAKLVPLTPESRDDLITNWFSDEWAIKNADGLISDYLGRLATHNGLTLGTDGDGGKHG